MKTVKDSAVSEVVGVLLMLSVTILLAGVVALGASGSFGSENVPISANIAAVDTDSTGIILEEVSGDSFSLDSISIRLGIREDSSKFIILTREMNKDTNEYLMSYNTGSRIITIGDRFKIIGEDIGSAMKFGDGEFTVKYGNHVSYVIYDSNGAPVSSGDIQINKKS